MKLLNRGAVRLSVHDHGPCYGVRVLLDGIERNNVIEADEEARYIVRYCTDETGGLVLNEDHSDLRIERLSGAVVILMPESGLEV